MHPIAFSLGPLQIHWYGVLLSLAMATGVMLYQWVGMKRGYASEFLLDACLWMLIGGLLGARVDAAVHDWATFSANPLLFFDPRQGGFAIHGGLFGGMLGLYLRCRREGVPVWEGLDMGLAIVFPSMAIGRIGCVLQGCCYGKLAEVPWGLTYPAPLGGPRHPVQLYEAALDLLFWPLILWVFFHSRRQGETMWTMLIVYPLIRFAVEFSRESIMWGPLSETQWGQLAIVLLALAGLAAGRAGLLGGGPRFVPQGAGPVPRNPPSGKKRKGR